jgi:hypothetical protein
MYHPNVSIKCSTASLEALKTTSQPTMLTDKVMEAVNALGGFGGILARCRSSPNSAANA